MLVIAALLLGHVTPTLSSTEVAERLTAAGFRIVMEFKEGFQVEKIANRMRYDIFSGRAPWDAIVDRMARHKSKGSGWHVRAGITHENLGSIAAFYNFNPVTQELVLEL